MEIIAYLLVTGLLVFLGRVGFILYEVLSMDFDFNRPWPDEITQTGQQEVEVFVLTEVQQEDALEVLNSKLIPN